VTSPNNAAAKHLFPLYILNPNGYNNQSIAQMKMP
jgi:hypothetical protein